MPFLATNFSFWPRSQSEKKSNMAAIFKMVTRCYKILLTFLCSQMKCHKENKSANFGILIPWEPIFHFVLGANLNKIQYGCHFQNCHHVL